MKILYRVESDGDDGEQSFYDCNTWKTCTVKEDYYEVKSIQWPTSVLQRRLDSHQVDISRLQQVSYT